MNDYNRLISLAEEAGCAELAEKWKALADALKEQETCKIVVAGTGRNGKNDFINELTGYEILEPGDMDEDDHPRRVSFEPMQPEPGIECIQAVNAAWYELSAAIYEMGYEKIVQNGTPAPEMYAIDLVCFLISATAPFNKDEINCLKALAPLDRQVIVSDMEYVSEEEREKVIAYITKANDAMGLPPVIVRQRGTDIGKLIRDRIPAYLELQQSRTARLQALCCQAADEIEKAITGKIREKKGQVGQEAAHRMDAVSEAERLKSDCLSIRTQLTDDKRKTIARLEEELARQTEAVTAHLTDQAMHGLKEAELEKLAVEQFQGISADAEKRIKSSYLSELKYVNGSFRILGLTAWTEETVRQLSEWEDESAGTFDDLRSSTETFGIPKEDPKGVNGLQTVSGKLLLGTGLALGGIALAPVSPSAGIASGIAVAGAGAASYLKARHDEANKALAKMLNSACLEKSKYIIQAAGASTAKAYDRIYNAVLAVERGISPQEEKNPASVEAARLENLLVQCKAIKEQIEK